MDGLGDFHHGKEKGDGLCWGYCAVAELRRINKKPMQVTKEQHYKEMLNFRRDMATILTPGHPSYCQALYVLGWSRRLYYIDGNVFENPEDTSLAQIQALAQQMRYNLLLDPSQLGEDEVHKLYGGEDHFVLLSFFNSLEINVVMDTKDDRFVVTSIHQKINTMMEFAAKDTRPDWQQWLRENGLPPNPLQGGVPITPTSSNGRLVLYNHYCGSPYDRPSVSVKTDHYGRFVLADDVDLDRDYIYLGSGQWLKGEKAPPNTL